MLCVCMFICHTLSNPIQLFCHKVYFHVACNQFLLCIVVIFTGNVVLDYIILRCVFNILPMSKDTYYGTTDIP